MYLLQVVTGQKYQTLSFLECSGNGKKEPLKARLTIQVQPHITNTHFSVTVLWDLRRDACVCCGRRHYRACGRRRHVSAVERRDLDGGVRPRLHSLHAGIRSGRHRLQHPGLSNTVLYCTCLCEECDPGG